MVNRVPDGEPKSKHHGFHLYTSLVDLYWPGNAIPYRRGAAKVENMEISIWVVLGSKLIKEWAENRVKMKDQDSNISDFTRNGPDGTYTDQGMYPWAVGTSVAAPKELQTHQGISGF